MKKSIFYILAFLVFNLLPIAAYAAGQGGVLDSALEQFQGKVRAWETAFSRAGIYIFWVLATISVVMTAAQLIFQRENIASFFAELIRLILFLGFFLWILTNGVAIASSIRDGLMQLAGTASGNGSPLSPSGVVDLGFDLFVKIAKSGSILDPIDSAVMVIIGVCILLILAVVGINMLLLLVTSYIVIYAGIIILGFGGGRWTSDMAIGYLKQVLNISLQLATMILLIGIGQEILTDTISAVGKPGLEILAIVLVQSAMLAGLVLKVPPMIGALSGGNGNGGIGFGVGNVIAGAAMIAGAAGAAAMALKGVAMEAAGLSKALAAAKGGSGGGSKKSSAVDAIKSSASSNDNSSKQDGQKLTAESGAKPSGGASSAGGGASSSAGGGGGAGGESGSSGGGSGGGESGSSGGGSGGSESGSSGGGSGGSESGSSGGGGTENSISGAGSSSPLDNNGGDFRQPETMVSKVTNTGSGSPLAAAMGSPKVSNWQATKAVAGGIIKNKWDSSISKTAGGRLAEKWKAESADKET